MSIEDGQNAVTPSPVRARQLLWAPLLGLMLGALLAGLISAVWIFAFRNGETPFVVGAAPGASKNAAFFFNMTIIAALYLPAIWAMWGAAKRLAPAPAIRFFAPVTTRIVLLAAATGVVAALACVGIEEVLSRFFHISFETNPAERLFYPSTPLQVLLAFVPMALIGPFAEEFYFRGFLLQWLRTRMAAWSAVALSALAFTLVHLFMLTHPGTAGWVTTAEVFVVGLLLGAWVLRTGSLWSSFALHAGYNSVVVVLSFLTPS